MVAYQSTHSNCFTVCGLAINLFTLILCDDPVKKRFISLPNPCQSFICVIKGLSNTANCLQSWLNRDLQCLFKLLDFTVVAKTYFNFLIRWTLIHQPRWAVQYASLIQKAPSTQSSVFCMGKFFWNIMLFTQYGEIAIFFCVYEGGNIEFFSVYYVPKWTALANTFFYLLIIYCLH